MKQCSGRVIFSIAPGGSGGQYHQGFPGLIKNDSSPCPADSELTVNTVML